MAGFFGNPLKGMLKNKESMEPAVVAKLLCILTSERVLLTPFAGRNRLTDANTKIFSGKDYV